MSGPPAQATGGRTTSATALRNAARRLLGTLGLRPRPRVSLEPIDPPRVGGRLFLRLRIETPVEVTVRDARVVFRRLTWRDDGGDAHPLIDSTSLVSETFTRIGHLQPGEPHEEISWFAIPAGSPPSGRVSRNTRVVHRVSARVRCADAPTLRRRIVVTVLPAPAATRRQEPGSVSRGRCAAHGAAGRLTCGTSPNGPTVTASSGRCWQVLVIPSIAQPGP